MSVKMVCFCPNDLPSITKVSKKAKPSVHLKQCKDIGEIDQKAIGVSPYYTIKEL